MTYSGKKQPVPPGNPPPLKHKKSRVLLKLAMGLAGLSVLLVIIILSLDLNTFREPVTEALSRATGLKIKLKFLDWSFSDGLKIKCKGVQIFSGETEEELVSTKDLLISLNWFPLLEQRLVINSVTLVEPVLKIPFQPLSQNSALPQSEQSRSGAVPNPSHHIKEEPSSSNELHNIREFLKTPNFTITEINLVAGQVILQNKGVGTETVLNTEARMRIVRNENRVNLVLDGIKLGTGNLMAQGEIRADDFLLEGSPVQANIHIQSFKVPDLLPVFKWVPDIQNVINKNLKLKGDFQELNLKLNAPIEVMTDFDSLISSADVELILKAQEVSMVQFGKTISISTIEAAIQRIDQHWKHKIALGMLGGSFETEGKMFHAKGAESTLDWTLDSHMILKKIHLTELKNTFFNQISSFPETGTLSSKVHIQGPVLRPPSLRAEGTVSTQNVSFPLQGTHISIVGMEGSGRWLGDRLNHQVRMTAFGGEISMKGDLNFKKSDQGRWEPIIDTELIPHIKLAGLRPLVKKTWFPEKGTLTGKVHLQGPVLRPQLLQAEGKMKILDTTIQYQGINVHFAAINGTGRWIKNRLAHEVKMKVFDGNVRVKGFLKMNKTNQGEWNPVIDSDVISQSVQLSSLQPLVQKDWFPKKGALAGTVHLQGPMLHPEAMKSKGYLKVLNLEVKVRGTPVTIPVIEVEGAWANSQLVHDLKMKVFDGDIQVKGRLHLAKDHQGNRDPVIDSKVFVKPVSLIRLKPLVAQNWFPEKGVMDGTVRVRGPIMRPQAIKVEGKLRAQNTAIQFEGRNINLAEIKGKGLWSEDHLRHQIQMKVFGGEVSVQGDLNFKKNSKGELDLIIDSEVIPKSIQLSSLRPLVQKDWFPEKGTLTGSVHLKGPVKRLSETILIGKLTGRKVFLKIAEKPVVLENTVLSFEPNAQNSIQIGFSLSNISVGELRLKKSEGKAIYSKETFDLKQGKIWPKTGQLLLNGTYKFEAKDYKLSFSGKGLRLEDFQEGYLEGPLSFKGSLYGRVLSEGFKKGLSGNFKIQSENGRVLKADGILTKILNTLNLKLLQGVEKGLPVDFLGGNGTIKNGILSTKNFKMVSPSLKLWVTGKADLSDEKIDAEVITIPLQRTNKIFNKLNALVAKTQLNNDNSGLLKKTINKIPLIGDTLAGKEDEEGLVDKVFKMIPFIGDKRKEGEQPEGLIKVYFSIDGTFEEPNVYFLPEKTFMFK